ncbi:MAG: lipoate--protein ligase family protein [Kiritimatiellaeota bacterium]|nr:lipoate--protein ligase family protein [Kiritimatiellota bacterium]
MLLVRTEELDVHRNLALEECLLDVAAERGPVLFLWRSSGAVVLGKNQNPWREINLPALRTEELVLARRCSGGGTVFHDAGNLNYALALPRDTYDQDQVFDQLVRAFQHVGIPVERGPHHSLLVHDRKFSGSAFCYRRRAALHHGTLLINADLTRLARVLTGGLEIITRAIASHPMSVVNLAEVKSGFDLTAAAQTVISAFAPKSTLLGDEFLETLPWREKTDLHRSWAWQFGQTPPFELKLERITLRVEHGAVNPSQLAGLTPAQRTRVAELFNLG